MEEQNNYIQVTSDEEVCTEKSAQWVESQYDVYPGEGPEEMPPMEVKKRNWRRVFNMTLAIINFLAFGASWIIPNALDKPHDLSLLIGTGVMTIIALQLGLSEEEYR